MFQIYSEIYLLVFSSNFILYFSNVDFLTVLILINPLFISLNNLILCLFFLVVRYLLFYLLFIFLIIIG